MPRLEYRVLLIVMLDGDNALSRILLRQVGIM